jgi:hypothetical protein
VIFKTCGGLIRGIQRGVRSQVYQIFKGNLYIDGPPPGPLMYCTPEKYPSLIPTSGDAEEWPGRTALKKALHHSFVIENFRRTQIFRLSSMSYIFFGFFLSSRYAASDKRKK